MQTLSVLIVMFISDVLHVKSLVKIIRSPVFSPIYPKGRLQNYFPESSVIPCSYDPNNLLI